MSSPSDPGSVGAGQQDPSDSNSEFTMMSFLVKQMIGLVDTIKVVQVSAVHPGDGSPPAAGTVDVQILLNQLDGAGNSTANGVVYGVPYFRLQGGAWAIVCDPAVGDVGLLACSDRDISSLKSAFANGKSLQVNPGSYRRQNASDGIFIPIGLNKVPKATMWLKSDGTFVIADEPGNVLQSSASGLELTPPSGGGLLVNGYIHATEEVVRGFGGADQVAVGTHTHGGVQGGISHTAPPDAGT
jgi:hypothetical protein